MEPPNHLVSRLRHLTGQPRLPRPVTFPRSPRVWEPEFTPGACTTLSEESGQG